MSFASDLGNFLSGGLLSSLSTSANDTSKAIQNVAGVFGTFFGDVTDVHFWRSLGWLALGLVLAAIGLIVLLRKPLGQAAEAVGKAGTIAAAAV
jgi:hypothetical protein